MALSLVAYESSDEDENEELQDEMTNKIQDVSYSCSKTEIVPSDINSTDDNIYSVYSEEEPLNISENEADDLDADFSNTYDDAKKDILAEKDILADKDCDDLSITLASLPKPKYHDISHNTITHQKFKIPIIESLIENDEEEAFVTKKKKMNGSQKGCGLTSLLPSPKHSQKFVPHQVSSDADNNNKQNIASNENKELKIPKSKPMADYFEDEFSSDNDNILFSDVQESSSKDKSESLICSEDKFDNINNDFFSLSSTDSENIFNDHFNKSPSMIGIPDYNHSRANANQLPNVTNSNYDNSSSVSTINDACDIGEGGQESYNTTSLNSDNNYTVQNSYQLENVSNSDIGLHLNDEAIVKLCGRRKKGQESILSSLIDIDEDKILSESKLLLSRHLTEEPVRKSSHKKSDGPSVTQKRKHQITYLAHQAKERELELKNQWASNRFTKKQTQAKYGF